MMQRYPLHLLEMVHRCLSCGAPNTTAHDAANFPSGVCGGPTATCSDDAGTTGGAGCYAVTESAHSYT